MASHSATKEEPPEPQIPRDVLEAARQGLEVRLLTVHHQIDHLRSLLGIRRRGRPHKAVAGVAFDYPLPQPPKTRKLSAETKKKIALAQRKRWETVKRTKG